MATLGDLILGFYGGGSVGSGVTSVVLTVDGNGTQLYSKTFTAQQALAFFTNNVLDLGSLASAPFGGGVATISVSLTVTTTTAGSSFHVNVLIGDPPSAASAPAVQAVGSPFGDYAHLLGATRHAGGELAIRPDPVASVGAGFAGFAHHVAHQV